MSRRFSFLVILMVMIVLLFAGCNSRNNNTAILSEKNNSEIRITKNNTLDSNYVEKRFLITGFS